MNRKIKIIFLFPFVTLLWQCKQAYVSPYVSPPTGYLVVEGYITGNGPTQFVLSRTIGLSSSADSSIPPEPNAKVQVEGDDNSIYPLVERGTGTYVADTLPLTATVKYRLRIGTGNGESYLSDYVPFRPTPAIDSINWVNNTDGVVIYANTHDPAGTTRYYQWQYDETWEYHSAEQTFFKYKTDTTPPAVVGRTAAEQVFRCWHSDVSTSLLLASSAKLAQDVICRQPLIRIPAGAQQLSVLYSTMVRQYALTEDAYNFLALMQKNTESLGSIFDVQPSELKGNIHCLNNPAEPVVGFISAGTVRQQRIYISYSQVFPWHYFYGCPLKDTVAPANKLQDFFGAGGFLPIEPVYGLGGGILGWDANYSSCIDCRAQGGTNIGPSFWPN